MALIPLTFFFVTLLIHGCSAQIFPGQLDQFQYENYQTQQKHRLQARTDCRVDQLTAQEPTLRYKSEAGRTEFWERNNQQFQCAGVAAVRNYIEPRGLLLPHFNNAPQLLYVVQGRGVFGIVFPGCAETFEYSGTQEQSGQERRFRDRHQKVQRFKRGDVLALPAGLTLWFYNNGEEPVVTVALLDTGNGANQLDWTFRNFFLAGNPKGGSQSLYGQQGETEGEQARKNNIFFGYPDETLADIYNVQHEIARNLKGVDDERGQIVRAEKFNVLLPGEEEERGQYSPANGLEETLCTAKFRENIDRPTRADVYNPRGGRISTLNSQKLPILKWLGLSAEKGLLYRNAILGHQWNVDSHAAIYIIQGSGRFQVVGHGGRLVFDGQVSAGQMIIIPQNYVIVKKAGEEEGLEWITFKTNDDAITSQLAGRLSVMRAMPEEVLMNAYSISREDARRLKYGREESRIFSSTHGRSGMPTPFEFAMGMIKNMV